MKKLRVDQGGSTFIVAFLGVVVLVVVAAVAWWVWDNHRIESNNSVPHVYQTVNCDNTSQGIITAGMLSLDTSKLPCGWTASSQTYTSDQGDYQSLGFRYAIDINNTASLTDNYRNNPALCYLGAIQIYKDPNNIPTINSLLQSDITIAQSTTSSGAKLKLESNSTVTANTPQGAQQLPAANYTLTYQDDGTQTKYNKSAYIITDNYVGHVDMSCQSQSAIDKAAKVIGAALTFQ